MNIILSANLSANGKLLLSDNPAHVAPPEALGFFVQKVIETGSLIIGRKTFEMLQSFPGGAKQLFPNVEIVLLSTKDQPDAEHKTVDSPEKAIAYLTEKGFANVILGGGTLTYNAFLEKDLVTEIYFGYIPLIIGDGGVIDQSDRLASKFNIAAFQLLMDGIGQIHLKKA